MSRPQQFTGAEESGEHQGDFGHSATGKHSNTTIQGVNAKLLNVQNGGPGFFMVVIGYNDAKVPVWIANVIFRGDAFELHNRRGPILTETSKFDISVDFKKRGMDSN